MPVWSVLLTGLLTAACVTSACGGMGDRITAPTSPGGGLGSGFRELPPPAPQPPVPPAVDRGPAPPRAPLPPASGTCDAASVQGAIGQRASDRLLERARVAAAAAIARFIRPNQPITTEFLGSRLNLTLDERDVVRSVYCG